MTTQAKNVVLAYTILVMLAIAIFAGNKPGDTNTTAVLIPLPEPIFVEIPAALPEPITASYSQEEFDCLRTNLYFEAGDQGRKGMEAVALVTLNRTKTKHFPSTVCSVVKARTKVKGRYVCQFSWYCDGKPDEPALLVKHRGKLVPNTIEIKVWELAAQVAHEALEGQIEDFLGRATHYHANYVNPRWANVPKRYRRIAVVGSHIFYRDIKLGLKEVA